MPTNHAATIPSGSTVPAWAENPLLQMRKLVLLFLQGLFEQADVSYFRWSESLEDTEIVITDESPLQLEVIGSRPAISTVRGPVGWGKTSLDQMLTRNDKNNSRRHTDLVSGNISLNCCSSEPLESEYLAWIVANHSWLLRRLLMKGTPVHDYGQGIQISSPTPAGALVSGDTEGEWICTTVSIPYFLQIGGTVTPLNEQALNSIQARMRIRGAAQVGPTAVRGQDGPAFSGSTEGVIVRAPTIRGRPIRDIALEHSLSLKKE